MEPLRQHHDGLIARSPNDDTQYSGMEVHQYGGMEANQYRGNGSDEDPEKIQYHAVTLAYDENTNSQLHRGMKSRQISMIALGGALGTGLLIQTGPYLANSGPASMLIGYALVGVLCFAVMAALGEMAAWLPLPSGFTGFADRFVHPALGFALGWNYWFHYIVTFPNNLMVSPLVIQSWCGWTHHDLTGFRAPELYIALILVCVVTINYFGVGLFGEIEFWLSSAKVLIMLILIVVLIVIATGGLESPATGFDYWRHPGAFASLDSSLTGELGKFLGFWNVLTNAVFSYLGAELVGVTVGEVQNPRKAIPRAVKLTFFRIVFFYLILILLLGMTVPYTNPHLSLASTNFNTGISPFIIAAKIAGFPTFTIAVNLFLIIFTLSASNSDLYIATRTIYALAVEGKAPKILSYTNRHGVPIYALGLSSAFGSIGFIVRIANEHWTAYQYLTTLVTTFGILTWISILISHIKFVRARRAQNVPDTALAYVSPFGATGSMVAVVFACVITFFNGFQYFIKGMTKSSEVEIIDIFMSYIGIVMFGVMMLGYKLVTKEKGILPDEADLFGGKARIDAEEEEFLAEQSVKQGLIEGMWQKVYKLTFGYFF